MIFCITVVIYMTMMRYVLLVSGKDVLIFVCLSVSHSMPLPNRYALFSSLLALVLQHLCSLSIMLTHCPNCKTSIWLKDK